jgi:hypothetical protein
MQREKIRLSDIIFSEYSAELKGRGFKNLAIIKRWKYLMFPSGIKNNDFFPFRISRNCLYFRTQNKEFYSEFNFYKKAIEEVIFMHFGESDFNTTKILLMQE